MRGLLYSAACVSALVLAAVPATGQTGQNIAGTYRGLMSGCLSVTRSVDCRKGFVELIQLADEVDARRVEWERAVDAGASKAKMQEEFEQARLRLNQAVDKFNRDMSSAAPER